MTIQRFSLHKIHDKDQLSFNPEEYSVFKFGDDKIAQKFGESLAQSYINEILIKRNHIEQIVVISSPYSFIPTASYTMKNHFVNELNFWLSENGHNTVQETKIYRTITYREDYGELSAEQRHQLIKNDHFYIDVNYLHNKLLVFLDDIKITGSHENMIKKMIDENKINNEIHLLYFAELINKEINPNIENHLNYYKIKSIFDLNEIINESRFVFNTRIVKYLLIANHHDFVKFVNQQSAEFQTTLLHLSIGNNYFKIDEYSTNYIYLKTLIKK